MKAHNTHRLAAVITTAISIAMLSAAFASPPVEEAPPPVPEPLQAAPGASVLDPLYTADEVAGARHCISEASGAQTDDCQVVAWIDQAQAARRGVSVAEFIATTYTRHTVSASRPWIGELNGDLSRPASWDEARIPWEPRGRAGWQSTLEVVRQVLAGRIAHGCNGTPLTWGGTMDNDGIRRWTSRGFRVLDCGETRNRFIGR